MPITAPASSRDGLYDLLPFVEDGDTAINVFTLNPSGDDNIFLAALEGAAVVGDGITLRPTFVRNRVNTMHTLTARVQDAAGDPVSGRDVSFTVTGGPNAGLTGTGTTDAAGEATFT